MCSSTHGLTAAEVRQLEVHHRDLLQLCLELEDVAAELDVGRVPPKTQRLAKTMEPLISAAHRIEEDSLYPDLERHAGSCFGSLMIAQIKAEHRVDHRAARELALTLTAIAGRRSRLGLDIVANMVRGFQEYLRRHVAAEQMLLFCLLAIEDETVGSAQ
ncbi:hemerythrin domain-containing protein [Rhizobium sp. 18065]|uniref:hemerythrin domain-containing protein n=1 Tax=Rhizobium sp. 18065 TaxID=2681411 RepID=UPI00135C54D0|nr:hemerythrin domain-containing protein [Rhizobium sp. 18065]